MKPILDPAFADRRNATPARLLALGLLAHNGWLDAGSIVSIAATAIRLLQRNADERFHSGLDVPRTYRAGSGRARDDSSGGPGGSFTKIIDFGAIIMPREHTSGWTAPIEVEIERSLSATVYQKEVFRSVLLGVAGDLCFGTAEGERLMVEIEGTDGAGRELRQSMIWDFPFREHNDQFIRRDAGQALGQLLRLIDSASDDQPELIIALNFTLCPRHLIDDGMAVTEYTLMRLSGIWITGRGATVDRGPYIGTMLPLRFASTAN